MALWPHPSTTDMPQRGPSRRRDRRAALHGWTASVDANRSAARAHEAPGEDRPDDPGLRGSGRDRPERSSRLYAGDPYWRWWDPQPTLGSGAERPGAAD